MNIIGCVVNQHLAVGCKPIVSDTVDYVSAKFDFCTPDWRGMTRIFAHFSHGETVFEVQLNDAGEITPGKHLNLDAGIWRVWLHGEKRDEARLVQRITTNVCDFTVQQSGMIGGEPFPEPPETELDRIWAEVGAVERTVGDHIDGLFDAGIKSITWVTAFEGVVNTIEDPLKAQRPEGTDLRYWGEFEGCPYFYHDKLYRVTFNGVVYDNLVCEYGFLQDEDKGVIHGDDDSVGGCWQMVGNKGLYDSRYSRYTDTTGEPFAILYVEHPGMHDGGGYYYSSTVGNGILMTETAQSVSLKIEVAEIEKKDLPKCFDENFGVSDDLFGAWSGSTYPRASWGQGNIVVRGSFATGISNLVTGQFSHAIGMGNEATGADSYAFGRHCSAQGEYSHASGLRCTASGKYSVAMGGGCSAAGMYALAAGSSTEASGSAAAALCNRTVANGNSSVAEGQKCSTTETAPMGHAEGNYTVSNGRAQHVQGSYNIIDESPIDASRGANARKYLHIVGNGASENARSNAHTLDWSGNAWYAGDIYVGGSDAESGQKLQKESIVDAGGYYTGATIEEALQEIGAKLAQLMRGQGALTNGER